MLSILLNDRLLSLSSCSAPGNPKSNADSGARNRKAPTRSRVEGIAENILALSEQTQQIGDIIATVTDIADQFNILALNAAIEAAQAAKRAKASAWSPTQSAPWRNSRARPPRRCA